MSRLACKSEDWRAFSKNGNGAESSTMANSYDSPLLINNLNKELISN